ERDLAGNRRLVGSHVDIGPYENQYVPITPNNNILYVDQNVDFNHPDYVDGSGSSWGNAVPELADALKWAQDHKDDANKTWDAGNPLKIYVATGTYKPWYKIAAEDRDGNPTTDRDNAFLLVPDVQLYGGFPKGGGDIADRDWENNTTTLSGDIDGNDDDDGTVEAIQGENAYHVVVSVGDVGTALLDGFTISGGKAESLANGSGYVDVNGISMIRRQGGGMYNRESSSPSLTNVVLSGNSADVGG